MKLLTIAIVLAAAAAALSGCIMYVAPDHNGWHHTHNDDKPAPDEKPADTAPANPA